MKRLVGLDKNTETQEFWALRRFSSNTQPGCAGFHKLCAMHALVRLLRSRAWYVCTGTLPQREIAADIQPFREFWVLELRPRVRTYGWKLPWSWFLVQWSLWLCGRTSRWQKTGLGACGIRFQLPPAVVSLQECGRPCHKTLSLSLRAQVAIKSLMMTLLFTMGTAILLGYQKPYRQHQAWVTRKRHCSDTCPCCKEGSCPWRRLSDFVECHAAIEPKARMLTQKPEQPPSALSGVTLANHCLYPGHDVATVVPGLSFCSFTPCRWMTCKVAAFYVSRLQKGKRSWQSVPAAPKRRDPGPVTLC